MPANKTVPNLYPEAEDFVVMPEVFATGYMVGLIEWTCIQLVNEHLDWPAEMTLGIHVDISHDGVDTIARGTHRRAIVDAAKFKARAAAKAESAGS